jgi:glutamine amidotransferase
VKIGIIKLPTCNIFSLINMLESMGINAFTIHTPEDLNQADAIIFPGTGSMKTAMSFLNENNIVHSLKMKLSQKTPYLGICLGMQILFNNTEENHGIECLGILNGQVKKLTTLPCPHIGFAQINESGHDFFFNHCYQCIPDTFYQTETITIQEKSIISTVQKDHLLGVQFHPEKSGLIGRDFLAKWIRSIS